MKAKFSLPMRFNTTHLSDAINIIPSLALAQIDFEFVVQINGADVRCKSVDDAHDIVNAWLRQRAAESGVSRDR